MTLIVQSHFDSLLRYGLSVTFFRAVVLKVMDHGSYKVRITMFSKFLAQDNDFPAF